MSDPTDCATTAPCLLHQHYFVELRGFAHPVPLSVRSFQAHEQLGDSYQITVLLPHPDELTRGDIVGKDATFRIVSVEGATRHFAGCVTAFDRIKRTKDEYIYRFVIEPHYISAHPFLAVPRIDGFEFSQDHAVAVAVADGGWRGRCLAHRADHRAVDHPADEPYYAPCTVAYLRGGTAIVRCTRPCRASSGVAKAEFA
ncbi:hypothetical protein DWU98_12460 [Dyella monticola]|uniref:Type VI secretion system tip protein VgrG n=1 Tax=Dyella monticola TaxID=1927958 RepID=A0A370WXQ5_9GAMM|nr:hypothetical protein DWU98_12460 [Dyella monticola]